MFVGPEEKVLALEKVVYSTIPHMHRTTAWIYPTSAVYA